MNVLVDLRALQSGNTSGVEVFVQELVRAMCQEFPQTTYILWTNSQKPLPENFPDFAFPNAKRLHTHLSNTRLLLSTYFLRRPKLDQLLNAACRKQKILPETQEIDIVFIPDPRPFAMSRQRPKVTLIHDLSTLHFPQHFSLKTRFWQYLNNVWRQAKESTRIVTPSRFSKEDIKITFGTAHEKIAVIGAGCAPWLHPVSDPLELAAVRAKYHLPSEFFLTLCTLEPRKNLANLIEAFDRFYKKQKTDEIRLVIAGKMNDGIFADLHLPQSPAVIFPGFIAESDKPALFSAAKGFLFPSVFEGFGLPVLEAMACGAPILSSTAASLPEVYGDAAVTFDPRSVGEMVEAIEKIVLDPKLRAELAEKSLKRSQLSEFAWTTVARKAMAVLEEAVHEQKDSLA